MHIFLLLIAFITTISCQSVTLLSPMGQTFYPNDLINIRWNYIGYPPTTMVRVSIVNPSGLVVDMRDSVIANSNVMFSLQSFWMSSYTSSTKFQVRLLVIPTNELRFTTFYGRKSKSLYIPGWGIALICVGGVAIIIGLVAAYLYYKKQKRKTLEASNANQPIIYAFPPQSNEKEIPQTSINIQNEKETNVVIQKA